MSDVVIIAEDDNDGSILVPNGEVINSCGSTGKTVTVKEAEFQIEIEKWLNDFITVTDRQWSTHELVAALNALKAKIAAIINDNAIQSTTAWSSLKTYQQILGAVNTVRSENEEFVDEYVEDRIAQLLNEIDLWVVNSLAFQNLQSSIDLINGPIELVDSLAWRLAQTKTAILEIEAQARAEALQQAAQETFTALEDMSEELRNRIQDEATERFNRVSELLDEIEINRNLISSESTVRATQFSSLTATQDTLAAAFDVNLAAFNTMTDTFASEYTVFTNQLNSFTASLDDKAESTVVNELTSRVSDVEGEASANAQAITAIQNSLFEDETGNVIIDGLAVYDLSQRVTANEEGIAGLSSAMTLVQNEIPNLASSSALDSLESRVSDTEIGLTLTGQRVTTIENTLDNDGIVANSESFQILQNAVSLINDEVISEATNITGLSTRIDNNEASILQEAQIRQTEDQILTSINELQNAAMGFSAAAVIASDEILITENEARVEELRVLEASVGELEGNITDLNQIIIENDQVTASRFGQVEASIDDVAGNITTLEQVVVDKDNSQSLRSEAIENRVGTIEGSFNDIVLVDVNGSGTLAERLQDLRAKTDDANANITNLEQIVIEDNNSLVTVTNQLANSISDTNTTVDGIVQRVSGVETNLDPTNPSSLAYDVNQIQLQITNGDLGQTIEAAIQESNTIETIDNGLQTLLAQRTVRVENNGLITGYSIVNDGTEGTIAFRADNFFITPSNTNTGSTRVAPFFVNATDNKVYMDNAFIRNLNAGVITTGQLNAARIDTRGLDVRDSSGNIILSANQNLDWNRIGGSLKPANSATRNNVTRSSSAPSGGVNGDIHIQEISGGPNIEWIKQGGSWRLASTVGATFNSGNGQITGQITSSNITTYIASAAIGAAQIGNAQITNAKIANGAINNAKIANGSITNAKIANAAVENAKIANGAITTAKIADGSITRAKIGTAAIGTAEIANAAITGAKIGSIDLVGTNNFSVKSGTQGARMEMDSRAIKVYDENGVVRVQIGRLDI